MTSQDLHLNTPAHHKISHGGPLLSPQHVQIIRHPLCSRPICHIKSPSELGEQTASPRLLGIRWPLPREENLPSLNSPGALPKILMGYFSLHTVFCLYFYLCLISLKRSGNCFFVDFAQCWVYEPSWVLSEAGFEDWALFHLVYLED